MKRLLIVGTGLTGASTANMVQKKLPGIWKVTLWDKARGAGGRMSTSRSREIPNCTTDLGAQYISVKPSDYQHYKRIYRGLQDNGLLAPMTAKMEHMPDYPDGMQHFVMPTGGSSVVKYFLDGLDVNVKYNQCVNEINLNEKDAVWDVSSTSGSRETFDCVLLTIPAPQVLQLKGDLARIIADNDCDIKRKLSEVIYSSRFALGLFYQPGVRFPFEWAASYVTDNSCIRFVALDNVKRGRDESPPALCVHTSVPFGLAHLEDSLESVQPIIMQHLNQMIPDLPEPVEVKCHKWRYSQTYSAYPDSPGSLIIHTDPFLICAGDAFIKSGFNQCLYSAESVLEKLQSV